MKLFYGAVRDLINGSINDCSVIAKTYESAERKLRKEYNKIYSLYEFELVEQDVVEANEYFENHPDCKKAGIYNNAPTDYAYITFI